MENKEDDPASKLMTYEEYAQRAQELDKGGTYDFSISTPEKTISYIGTSHSFDPNDPFFADLEAKFILQHPTSVFIEGVVVPNARKKEMFDYLRTQMTREQAIQEGGEALFTLWLAAKHEHPEHEIAAYCPEPDFNSEITAVETAGFSREDILAYHIYRLVQQFIASGGNPDRSSFVTYLNRHIEPFTRIPGWDGTEIEQLTTKIADTVDFSDPNKYIDLSDPIPWEGKEMTATNKVAAATNRFRDINIVNTITQLSDRNSLVVYGKTHAIMQEPALRHKLAVKN
jgi:hypothetical protein